MGGGVGGHGRSEQRKEVFVKIQKKKNIFFFFFFFWGGGGGVGWVRDGVEVGGGGGGSG